MKKTIISSLIIGTIFITGLAYALPVVPSYTKDLSPDTNNRWYLGTSSLRYKGVNAYNAVFDTATSTDFTATNLTLYDYLIGFYGGTIDMRGDPWYLSGTDLEIAQDLQVTGTSTLATTTTADLQTNGNATTTSLFVGPTSNAYGLRVSNLSLGGVVFAPVIDSTYSYFGSSIAGMTVIDNGVLLKESPGALNGGNPTINFYDSTLSGDNAAIVWATATDQMSFDNADTYKFSSPIITQDIGTESNPGMLTFFDDLQVDINDRVQLGQENLGGAFSSNGDTVYVSYHDGDNAFGVYSPGANYLGSVGIGTKPVANLVMKVNGTSTFTLADNKIQGWLSSPTNIRAGLSFEHQPSGSQMGSVYLGVGTVFYPNGTTYPDAQRTNAAIRPIYQQINHSGFHWYADATGATGSYTPTERMRLDYNGNLMLATTTAISGAELTVAGDIGTTGNVGIGNAPSASVRLYATDATDITYDPTSITNPIGVFYQADPSGFASIRLMSQASGGSLQKQGTIAVIDGDGANTRNSSMAFGLRDDTATVINEKMRLDYRGYLGISTTSPTNFLTVYAGATNAGGITLDGTNDPAIALKTGDVAKGYLAAITDTGAFFTGTVAGDIVLRGEAGGRVVIGEAATVPTTFADGLVGIGTFAPTHGLTFASTPAGTGAATGIAWYNTIDQTTNYERVVMKWTAGSNRFDIGSYSDGTGGVKVIRIGVGTNDGDTTPGRYLNIGGSDSWGRFNFYDSTASNIPTLGANGNHTSSNGNQIQLSVKGTVNQSSTASYTAFRIWPTLTTLGAGPNYLMQVGTSTNVNLMTFDILGKMGIGTSTPTTKLHVVGNAGATTSIANGSAYSGRGRDCYWNGTNYTYMYFADNSITPLYATSTTCE